MSADERRQNLLEARINNLREEIDVQANLADNMFAKWGGGKLYLIYKEICSKIENDDLNDPDDVKEAIYQKIQTQKKSAIDNFVKHKKQQGEKFENYSRGDVSGTEQFDLDKAPRDSDGYQNWLHTAKRAAIRLQQFISHTARKNPHPTRRLKGEDTRENERSIPEQNWLTEQDKLTKLIAKLKKAEYRKSHPEMMKKKNKKKNKKSEHSKGKDEPPPGPRHHDVEPESGYERKYTASRIGLRAQADKRQTPTRGRSAKPANPSASKTAQVARRIPAFPAFPGYK